MMNTRPFAQPTLLLIIWTAALAGNPAEAETMQWVYEAVDPQKTAGDHSAALDAQDRAHIVYGRDALYYDWEEADGWHSEVVDATAAPGAIAMVADDFGHLHVGYVDGVTRTLKYARRDPAGWSIETIAEDAYGLSLCLDSAGWPHVACEAGTDQVYHGVMLQHLNKDASGWHTSTVGVWSEVRLYDSAIRVADDGQPHLALCLQRYEGAPEFSIFHFWRDHTGWQSAEVAGDAWETQFDAAGRLHAVCDDGRGYGDLFYALVTRDTFVTEPLRKVGYEGYPSTRLVVSRAGVPHVLIGNYRSWSGLEHWSKVGGVWQQTMVDTNATYEAVMALDAGDRPHVLYRVKVGEDWRTKSAWQDEEGWHTQEETSGPPMLAGSGSLLLTDDNRPRFVHSNRDSGTSFYSKEDAGWHERVLAQPSLRRIRQIRLALDAEDNPHIAYNGYDMGSKYAWRDPAGWHTKPLEDAYPTGDIARLDLALDSEGRPHIGYLSTNHGLAYAVLGDAGWESTVVAIVTNAIHDLALALDGMEWPHFLVNDSDYAASTSRLAHIWQDDGGWHRETVALRTGYWVRPGIAVDHTGGLHIAYYDQDPGDELKYGYRTPQGWQITTVDTTAAAAWLDLYCSLDLDDQNQPHIAYTVGQPGQLRYARKDATGWHISTVDSAGEFYDFRAFRTSLCLAPDGTPHIAYARYLCEDEVTLSAIQFCYARLGANGWEVIVLEESDAWCSLVVDAQSRPHIAYAGCRDNLSYIVGFPAPPALDHFTWSAVPSPRPLGVPFPVTLTARNSSGLTVTSFTHTVTLSSHAGGFTSTNLTVGNGTGSSDFPLFTWCHDARTQAIYPASDIGQAGTITSLALEVTTPPGQILQNWIIRMKHTALTEYSVSPEWEGSGWTVLYQGDEPVGTVGWRTFEFSTPFEYNGKQNLLVDFSFNNASASSAGQCRSTIQATPRSLWSYSDSWDGDPLSWSGTTPFPIADWTVPNLLLEMRRGSVAQVPVSPAIAGPFISGVWTGMVTVHEAVTNLVLLADDGSGHGGESNPFSVLRALRLRNWRFVAGQFAFDLDGEPGAELLIQASTNLVDWVPIATNTLDTAPVLFTDPQSGQVFQRFYRLLRP